MADRVRTSVNPVQPPTPEPALDPSTPDAHAAKLRSRHDSVLPFGEPRRFRALLYARRGNRMDAITDINACLEREPAGGAALYAAACVTALLAERADNSQQKKSLTEQSLAFLEKAFAQGYGQDGAADDKDLASLRSNTKFRRLLEKRTRNTEH